MLTNYDINISYTFLNVLQESVLLSFFAVHFPLLQNCRTVMLLLLVVSGKV